MPTNCAQLSIILIDLGPVGVGHTVWGMVRIMCTGHVVCAIDMLEKLAI